MNGGVYIVMMSALMLIDVICIAMMARVILSWFGLGEQSKLGNFLYVVTEPIILPLRALCARFGWFSGIPFDMPFFITMVLLTVISTFLQAYIGV